MSSAYLYRMIDKFLAEESEVDLRATNADGVEESIVILNKGSQRCVLYNFMEWMELQDSLLTGQKDVIH